MALVDQIFEQAKLGTAPDPSANPFALGLQLGQHQQQIDQQKQQLAMELAQLPLKQTLLQQDAAYKAAQTEQLLHNQQTVVQTQEQLAGLAGAVSKALTEATPEDAAPLFFDAVQKTPRIAENPYFQKLWQDVQASVNAKAELQKLKANEFTAPYAVEVPSPKTGEPPFTAIRTGPNSFTLPQSSVTEFTTPEGAVFQQRTGAGGAPSSGAGPGGLPQAVASKLQEKQSELSGSLALLNESLGLISPQNTGPLGKLNRAKEAVQSFVAPGSAAPVTEAQTTFGLTAQSLYKGLKADSQINKLEATEMRKLANITDWTDTSDPARAQYRTVADIAAIQSVLISHKLGQFAQEDALKALSPERAARYWKAGVLTNAEVEKWNSLHGLVQ